MDSPTAVLLSQGVLGVVTLGLTFSVVTLYKDNKALQNRIHEIEELRVADQKETQDKIVPVMSNFSETVNLIYDKLRVSKRIR